MLALTRKTDYGLIALCHMARHPGEVCTAREIAERYKVPQALLMNVMKTLNQGGIVKSIRGARGGYSLAGRADGITLSDIIKAVEGPIRFVQCAGAEGQSDESSCDLLDTCPVTRPVRQVHEQLDAFLRTITLAQIASDDVESCQQVSLTVEKSARQVGAAAVPVA